MLAETLAHEHGIPRVQVGNGGETPKEFKIISPLASELPSDSKGYGDSLNQSILADKHLRLSQIYNSSLKEKKEQNESKHSNISDRDFNEWTAISALSDESIQQRLVPLLLQFGLANKTVIKQKMAASKALSQCRTLKPYATMNEIKSMIDEGAYIDLLIQYGGRTPLQLATLQSDIESMKYFLSKGADPKKLDASGYSLLAIATEADTKVLSYLLRTLKYDVHMRDKDGKIALHHAIMNMRSIMFEVSLKQKSMETISLLLEHKADVNDAQNDNQSTPFHYACEADLELTSLLLKQGANLEAINKHGNTPIHSAVGSKNWDVVRYLVKQGAKIDVINGYNTSVLDRIALEARYDKDLWKLILSILEEHKSICSPTELLLLAIQGGNFAMVTDLVLNKKVDVNIAVRNRWPLAVAADENDTEMVTFLLQHGAKLDAPPPGLVLENAVRASFLPREYRYHNKKLLSLLMNEVKSAKGEDYDRALQILLQNNEFEHVLTLFKKGANIHAVFGNVKRSILCETTSPDHITTLLKLGAMIELADNERATPLLFHAYEGNVTCVERLLEHQANIHTKAVGDHTALHCVILSISDNKDDFLQALSHYNSGEIDIYQSLLHRIHIIKRLIVNGIDVDAKNKEGKTAYELLGFTSKQDFLNTFYPSQPKKDSSSTLTFFSSPEEKKSSGATMVKTEWLVNQINKNIASEFSQLNNPTQHHLDITNAISEAIDRAFINSNDYTLIADFVTRQFGGPSILQVIKENARESTETFIQSLKNMAELQSSSTLKHKM